MMMTIERALGKSQKLFKKLERLVVAAERKGQRADAVERQVFDELMHLGQALLEVYFAQAGDGDVGATVEREGHQLKRLKKRQTRAYRSVFGVVRVTRWVYALRHGQKSYAPLDEKLALPAGEQSYVLEDWLQRFCVQNAYGQSVRSLRDLLGIKTSKRTAERINQELASFVEPFRKAQSTKFDDDQDILVVSADGKGITMRSILEQRRGVAELPWRRCHRKKQEAIASERAKKRLGRGQVKNRKQIAYVGAVYTIGRWKRTVDDIVDEMANKEIQHDRPRPQNKRVQAVLTDYVDGERRDGQPALFSELAEQVQHRDPQRKKPLICLMDGQRSLWGMQREWLPRATCIVDIFHVTEYVWNAAYCFHREGSRDAEEMLTTI